MTGGKDLQSRQDAGPWARVGTAAAAGPGERRRYGRRHRAPRPPWRALPDDLCT